MTEKMYRIFYLNHGKFFVSIVENGRLRQAITKIHPTFHQDCKWFTRDQALKFIKENRHMLDTWGIVDDQGKQEIIK